ncbi:propionyl-coenzyme A carboxylase alpha polypeptide, partial [Mesorhizobium sp. M7A.F.Ca.CA.004.09.1.2]
MPPSALPGISPSRGEIGCHLRFRQFSKSWKRRVAR